MDVTNENPVIIAIQLGQTEWKIDCYSTIGWNLQLACTVGSGNLGDTLHTVGYYTSKLNWKDRIKGDPWLLQYPTYNSKEIHNWWTHGDVISHTDGGNLQKKKKKTPESDSILAHYHPLTLKHQFAHAHKWKFYRCTFGDICHNAVLTNHQVWEKFLREFIMMPSVNYLQLIRILYRLGILWQFIWNVLNLGLL